MTDDTTRSPLREEPSRRPVSGGARHTSQERDDEVVTGVFRYEGAYFEIVIADDDVKLKHISRDRRVTLLIFETTPFRGVQVSDEAEITRAGLDETSRSITSRYLYEESARAFTQRRTENGAVVRIPARRAKTWDLAPITT